MSSKLYVRQKAKRLEKEDHDKIIELYSGGMNIKQVSEELNFAVDTVSRFLHANNIYIKKSKTIPEEMKTEVCRLYKSGESFMKIYKKIGLGQGFIAKILKEGDVKSRPAKFHTIDEEYFKEIDSHKKAYFIGLILSDGCVCWNRPKTKIDKLQISLTKEDSYLLDMFIKETDYSGKLREIKYDKTNKKFGNRRDARVVGVYNMNFVSELTKYGIFPNKSMTHPFFQNIPEEFMCSALLGFFDGDGSVSFVKKENRLAASMIGSIEFIEEAKNLLHDKGISCSSRIRYLKSGNQMGELRMKGNRSCLKFYRYLYQSNIPSLNRKRAKFEYVIEQQRLGNIKDTNI